MSLMCERGEERGKREAKVSPRSARTESCATPRHATPAQCGACRPSIRSLIETDLQMQCNVANASTNYHVTSSPETSKTNPPSMSSSASLTFLVGHWEAEGNTGSMSITYRGIFQLSNGEIDKNVYACLTQLCGKWIDKNQIYD